MFDLDAEVRKWKAHVLSAGSIGSNDGEELESHLRDSIDELTRNDISTEEAFLIAVRRLGDAEIINAEFAKVSTEEVWRQLFIPAETAATAKRNRTELLVVMGLALLGGLSFKVPALFGLADIDAHALVYLRNAALFAFFPVAWYFIYKRSLDVVHSLPALGLFVLGALVVNLYPAKEPSDTAFLAAIHLPIAFLFLLVFFYGGPSLPGREIDQKPRQKTGWRNANTRLNFVRFAGETFIYAVLIGLGGVVLIGLTIGTFDLIGIDVSNFIGSWVAPFGLFGLCTVAAYLVNQKKHVIESLAPVLARIFTPLFLVVTISLIVAFAINAQAAFENRTLLIWFDVLLAFVLALTLYSMSSKATGATWGIWDILSLALILSAVLLDAIALSGIVFRLSNYGFTPNKSAALGENVLLLVNLTLLAIGYVRYLTGRQPFQKIVEMQMGFLGSYAAWAAFVVVVFPIIFGFK
jgi:hypothetical protein